MIIPHSRRLALLTVKYIGVPLLGLVAYDVVIVLYQAGYLKWAALEQIPLSLFGSVIGVILAFRNSSSYARWWEARTLWGSIVNNSRSWARAVTTVMRGDGDHPEFARIRHQMIYYQIAWVHALRQHLRRLEPWAEIAGVLSPEEIGELRGQKNVPVAIQQRQSLMLRRALDAGWIDVAQWHAMNQSLDDLVDAQGGAEQNQEHSHAAAVRLSSSPLRADVLLSASAGDGLGPWVVHTLGSTGVGFIFLTLDKIGRDLEDPFDNTVHDIPLTAICRTIEINLRQMLGEVELPPDAQPVDGVLW